MKYFLTLFALLLLCGCTKTVSKSDFPLYYSIVLNTDEYSSITNAPTICIYINGNPVDIFVDENSIAIPINEFLRPGTNELRITDLAKRSWDLAVEEADQKTKSATTLLETNFDAPEKGFAVSLNLTNVTWSLPLFDSVIPENLSTNSVLEFLNHVYSKLPIKDEKDESSVVNLLQNDGWAIWQTRAYGVKAEVLADEQVDAKESLESVESVTESPTSDTIKIIRGPNAIMVYCGVASPQKIYLMAYLARLQMKDGSKNLSPDLMLYRKNGGWAIWK